MTEPMLRELQLLTIRADDDATGNQHVYPIVDAGGVTPQLEPGEQVIYQFPGSVTQLVGAAGPKKAWELPRDAVTTVTVTDRRIAYVCRNFTRGSTWIGFGPLGVAAAGTAMAVSAVRARRRRDGRSALGQVRFDWLDGVGLLPFGPATDPGMPVAGRLVVQLREHDGRAHRLLVTRHGHRLDEPFVRWVAAACAYRRLNRDGLAGADRDHLASTLAQEPESPPLPWGGVGADWVDAALVHAWLPGAVAPEPAGRVTGQAES